MSTTKKQTQETKDGGTTNKPGTGGGDKPNTTPNPK